MLVVINGETRELSPGATVAEVIAITAGAPEGRGIAVALDGEVVPRARWQQTALSDGARLELVVAVQGG